jgi:hypothetical protein
MKSLGKHIEAVSTACWNHVLFNFTKSPHC